MQLRQVLLVVFHTSSVLERIAVIILIHGTTVLGDDDAPRRRILVLDPSDQAAQAPWDDVPTDVGFRPRRVDLILHLLVLKEALRVALRISRYIIRGVVVQSEEIRRAFDQLLLFRREGRQAVSAAHPHCRRVLAPVEGLREPAQLPVQRSALRGQVGGRAAHGLLPVHVQGHAQPALLLRPELRTVTLHSPSVRQDHVVRHEVRLRGRALLAPRRMLARGVAQHCRTPRLVEGAPMPDSIAKLVEACDGIVLEVIHHLPVEPTAILIL
mmetsp:Transcript_106903/g.312555  ORF Transcript_106903/g.312555 Transcript_106903/m.312555 type:complete len:269 (-) Transcript_106903:665-1471(-)